MALILSLDNLLKLASTESALGLDLVFNYEMMIGGGATLLVGLLAGAPAYGQTKFNDSTTGSRTRPSGGSHR